MVLLRSKLKLSFISEMAYVNIMNKTDAKKNEIKATFSPPAITENKDIIFKS